MSVGVDSKNIIVTQNGTKYQKADKGKVAEGVLLGDLAGGAALQTARKLSRIPISYIKKDVAVFKDSNLSQAIDIAFVKSGLANKGVKFINATEANTELVKETINKALPKWMDKVPPLKNIMLKGVQSKAVIMSKGENACFVPRAKAIIVNKEKIGWAAFHEMGHALNKFTPGVGKVLRSLKIPGKILALVAILTGLFKRKKVEGEKPQGAWDKTTTFIKNNCGKLAFLGMAPLLAEEGLASIKGAKLAKGLLSPEQFKTLNKLYGKAWLTYAGLAVGTGLAAYVASKVRDSIAAPTKIS